jgi:hypothetical protein
MFIQRATDSGARAMKGSSGQIPAAVTLGLVLVVWTGGEGKGDVQAIYTSEIVYD